MWRLIYYEWILIWNLQSIFLNPACAKSYFYHESYAIKGNSYLEFKVGYRMEIKCLVSRFYEEINILRVNSYLEFTTNIFVTPPIGCMTHRSGVNIFQFYRRRYLKINFQFTSNAMDFFLWRTFVLYFGNHNQFYCWFERKVKMYRKLYFYHQSYALQVNSYLEFKLGYRIDVWGSNLLWRFKLQLPQFTVHRIATERNTPQYFTTH